MKKRRNIFGVSWRKLQESPVSPAGQGRATASSSTRKVESGDCRTSAITTLRDTLGTLRQVWLCILRDFDLLMPSLIYCFDQAKVSGESALSAGRI